MRGRWYRADLRAVRLHGPGRGRVKRKEQRNRGEHWGEGVPWQPGEEGGETVGSRFGVGSGPSLGRLRLKYLLGIL